MIDILALAVGLAALVAVVPLIIGCAQCFHRFLGFKDNVGYSQDIESGLGSTQDLPAADGTLYPPGESLDTESIKGITFEPLPDIVGHQTAADSALRPRVSTVTASENIRQAGYRYEVPRGQLFYVTEVGSGWFGQVLQGDAEKLRFGQSRTKVIVKVLKDDATPREQLQFLEEVRVFREVDHPNVLRFLGQCTETIPYLTILEHAANGDLKSYLLSNREDQEAFLERGILLKFACEMAAGLACMHRHDFIHRDFATRNCVVTNDFCVKVGDYGISEDIYKDDYMALEDDLIPIRWMAPETVAIQDGRIQVTEITRQANIWSLGVALWELCMLGERPYNYMTNDGVVTQVVLERFQQLPEPTTPVPWRSKVYDVMKFCWRDERPNIDTVYKALQHLWTAVSDSMMAEFDAKWKLLVDEKQSRSGSQTSSGEMEKEVVVNGSGPPIGHHELRVKAEVLAEEEIAGSAQHRDLQELATSSLGIDLIENFTPSKKTAGEELFQMTSTPIDKSEMTSSHITPPSASSNADAFITAKENLSITPSDSEVTSENLTEDLQKAEEARITVSDVSDEELVSPLGGDNQELTQDDTRLLIDVGSPQAPVSPSEEDSTLQQESSVLSRPDIIEDLVPRGAVQIPSDVQAPSSEHLHPIQSSVLEGTEDPGERDADGESSSQTKGSDGQEVSHAKEEGVSEQEPTQSLPTENVSRSLQPQAT
ncbi:serine/threonine-protein kinase LMTK2-like [Liolophura sinensis]|uniref:serine/threonine-protein kinase LMTK2-like n=1 Tax=Liolophura sinensis TaxID=3198878 RepID=UPI00315848EC